MSTHQDSDAAHQPDLPAVEDEIFASILSLEEEFHSEGYSLGLADGARAGRIEGRQFGLEKGLIKALEMGKLRGRATVWSGRLSHYSPDPTTAASQIPSLNGSERMRKHVERLVELTDPASLETKNTEEAVQEFEERLGGAKAKLVLLRKMMDEDSSMQHRSQTARTALPSQLRPAQSAEMEDFSSLSNSRGARS
nr:oral cancer-overexpressed protein 1 like [Quercus suber]